MLPDDRSTAWEDAGIRSSDRRKVLDLVEAARSIAEIVKALGNERQAIYTWRRQGRIDKGLLPGLSSHEHDELVAARRRIAYWRPSWRSLTAPPSC
jgi:hypothetical protein